MIDFRQVASLFIANNEVSELWLNGSKVWEKKRIYRGLTFIAESAGATVAMKTMGSAPALSLEYTTDKGANWSDFIVGSTTVTLTNIGDEVQIRAKTTNSKMANSYQNGNIFNLTGSIGAYGDATFMLDKNGGLDTIGEWALGMLFWDCTGLTHAPDLPSTHLGSSAYDTMFCGCTSLTEAPELPATDLGNDYCYSQMFAGCTSLTKAPYLPATNLKHTCYLVMFQNCTSLNEIKIAYTGSFSTYYMENWVDGVAASGTFYYKGNDTSNFGSSAIPTGWNVRKYTGMKFTAEEANSTVAMTANGSAPSVSLEYTTDGDNWNDFIVGTTTVTLSNVGDWMALRAKTTNERMGQNTANYNQFVMTGKIAASGSIMYLLKNDGDLDTIPDNNYCFCYLFKDCASLTQAPELPATTLWIYCYYYMFYGCTSLTTAPELPATALVQSCYQGMFNGCSSLTQAPELPATTLASSCYYSMFYGCSSLNSIKIGYTGNFSGTGVPTNAFNNWVNGVASSGDFYYGGSDTTTGASAIPTGWTVKKFYEKQPLTFVARTAGATVSMTTVNSAPSISLEYSTDNGSTWSTFTVGSTTVTLANIGDEVQFRGNNSRTSTTFSNDFNCFRATGYVDAKGNPLSLIDATNFASIETITTGGMLAQLFNGCTGLVDASNVILSAKNVNATHVYAGMFAGCTDLVNGPDIWATSFYSNYSCGYIFEGDTSLATIKLRYYTGDFGANAFWRWVSGVPSGGTLYYNGSDRREGIDYVPSGWTVQSF